MTESVGGLDTRARPAATRRFGDPDASRAFIVDGFGAPALPHRLRGAAASVDHSSFDHTSRRVRRGGLELPCRRHDPALWFAEAPADLERAKALCAECPIRLACLAVAVDRAEYTGVWGGHIFDRGRIVPRKRPRGRPRKHSSSDVAVGARQASTQEHDMITSIAAVPDPDLDRVHVAAERLYDAECALHVAHQTGVDTWINAANQRLHDAVAEYLAAAGQRPPSTAA